MHASGVLPSQSQQARRRRACPGQLPAAAIEVGNMLIICDYAVLHADEIIERDDCVDCRTTTDQVNSSVIAEGEVARINCDELVFESGRALPDDAGCLADRGYILTNLALLSELAISA